MIRTLLVDDSSLVRSIIREFLEEDGSFEIIGEAENGLEGVQKARELNPDLITMDIAMPVMNGLEAIGEIKKTLATAIVVISTYDTTKMAYDATVKGALEFYAKDIFTAHMTAMQRTHILDTLKHITGIKRRRPLPAPKQTVVSIPRNINTVVIASSTGGPKALSSLCAAIPENFSAPIVLVQHNTSGFDKGFVQWLGQYASLKVRLAQEGTVPLKGTIYVAPTDKHLLLGRTGFLLDDGEPLNNQKPAADALFKSAAALYGNSVISVVLTGMGCDGAEGTRHIKESGGLTIAQDEETSMIYGMPKAAAETGCVDMVLPLEAIAERLVFLTKGNV